MRALEQGLGVDLGRTQRRGRVGGEERVARCRRRRSRRGPSRGGAWPAVGCTARRCAASRSPTARGWLAEALERVLQGEGVHHRAEHADVVGLGGVHADVGTLRPRQKLPPPTTTATSTSRFWRRAMISRAVGSRVAASSPTPPAPASASPDGLKTIRFQRGLGAASCSLVHRSFVEASPGLTGGAPVNASRRMLIRSLRSLSRSRPGRRRRCWRRRSPGRPTACRPWRRAGRASTTPLKKPCMRPSMIFGSAASGLPSLRLIVSRVVALVVDDVGGHVVAGEVLRTGEGDVHGDVVGQRGVAAGHLDEHAVDPAAALHVEVAVEHVAGGRLQGARRRRARSSP